ncbi:MAG TPA: transposase, partial [Tepidisphaeraceae bacterium]|nr:transposase [Tepidisphaeraceae bacterium]
TDRQWRLTEPFIPPERRGGRTRSVDVREVPNGIFHLLRSGRAWRDIPHDLPAWGTCRHHYDRSRRDGTWLLIHGRLRERVRLRAGRHPDAPAAVVDARSVRTTGKGGSRVMTRASGSRAASGT